MMRLSEPEYDFAATLDECIGGVTGKKAFKEKIVAARSDLLQAGTAYIAAGNAGELYAIAPIDTTMDKNPVVVGSLVKSELVNLYEYYFLNKEKASRTTYDKLLNSAHEQCPFCGGIGTPRNLDHFLPKAHFPQFSTFPQNLVPSCRDCNMDGKAVDFARRVEDQLIQPYVDHDRFFTTQWIFAKCILDATKRPTSIHYFVAPPQGWDQVHKYRVQKHFDDFGLAKRYSVKAAQLLETTLGQISGLQKWGMSAAAISGAILTPGIDNAPFVNHWQKGMFQALRDYL
ncbi:HNH endonuclease signature motif containing protein [Janthinobacterium sp.]|uniref:HNH endonuclease n=1 Tax=Janthinobacterium sp. TaxID=1871054 RepID=UPI00293D77C3|nr:HNH endonuclease signature motif containing protein [Janthinobacterium sp.]